MASVDDCELALLAVHTAAGLRVRHPDRRVVGGAQLTTWQTQGRSGQVRSVALSLALAIGQVRAGQVRAGQVRSGRWRPDCH